MVMQMEMEAIQVCTRATFIYNFPVFNFYYPNHQFFYV